MIPFEQYLRLQIAAGWIPDAEIDLDSGAWRMGEESGFAAETLVAHAYDVSVDVAIGLLRLAEQHPDVGLGVFDCGGRYRRLGLVHPENCEKTP